MPRLHNDDVDVDIDVDATRSTWMGTKAMKRPEGQIYEKQETAPGSGGVSTRFEVRTTPELTKSSSSAGLLRRLVAVARHAYFAPAATSSENAQRAGVAHAATVIGAYVGTATVEASLLGNSFGVHWGVECAFRTSAVSASFK